MNKWGPTVIAAIAIISLLAGCGGSQKDSAGKSSAGSKKIPNREYKDGTYTAKSSPDAGGESGEITLVIEKGKVTQAAFKGFMKNGQLKDQDYGKTNGKIENQDYYRKAQRAVKAMAAYPAKLIERQDIAAVDAISGATVSYRQFREAVKKALQQATP